MKLICFSNNTAGGLLCDLLNNRTSDMTGYRTEGPHHSAFKVGDAPGVQWSVDTEIWNSRIIQNQNFDCWLGTHAHPSAIPDIQVFDKVIAITTMSRSSKLYRWLRYYHGWWKSHNPQWRETNDLVDIDQMREMAKNVFVEFTPHPNCWNIEFCDIVDGIFVEQQGLNLEYFHKWKSSNQFLNYDTKEWAYLRFCEAEWEILHKKPYKYT